MTWSWRRPAVILASLLLVLGLLVIAFIVAFVMFWNHAIIDDDLRARTQERRARETIAREERKVARRQRAASGPTEATHSIPAEAAKHDPVQRLIRSRPSRMLLVMELSALRHSSLGERMLGCLTPNVSRALQVPEAAGVDFFEMFDRLAMLEPLGGGEPTVMVTGHFGWAATLLPQQNETYVFPANEDGSTWAVWRGEALLLAPDAEQLAAAIAALAAQDAPEPSDDPEPSGEVYMEMPAPNLLKDVLRGADLEVEEAARTLHELADSRGSMRIDLMSDLEAQIEVPAASGMESRPLDHRVDRPLNNDNGTPSTAHIQVQRDETGLHYQANIAEAELLSMGDEACQELRGKIETSLGESPVVRFLLSGTQHKSDKR